LTQGTDFDTSLIEVEPTGDKGTEKQPSPADFGFGVTIGIAARSLVDACFVLVSDRRVTLGEENLIPAADNAMLKELFIVRRWRALFAGDTAYAVPIVDRVREKLKPIVEAPTGAQVKTAFREAFQEEYRMHAADEILSRYNLTFEEFKKAGRALGAGLNEVMEELKAFRLGITFLVCGFSETQYAQMFCITDPGRIRELHQMDYWAIGSGVYHALSALTGRPIASLPISEVVYRCCEAKFVAESASGIGPDTTVHVMNANGEDVSIRTEDLELMRKVWKVSLINPAPKEIRQLIGSRLGPKFGGVGRVLNDE
jgi:ATP-dependent protease HslVU (ClpYQ) peptidase subunit